MAMTQADWAALAQMKAAGLTEADVQALAAQSPGAQLAAAVAAGGGAYLTALNAQKQAELAGLPVSGGSVGGQPGTSTASVVGQDAISAVQAAYPDLAWLLNVPDVAPLIVQAAQQGMGEAEFKAKFESTGWYQTTSQSVRNWIAEVETDPAQANADMQAQKSALAATLAQLGVGYTDQQLTELAQQSLAMQWSDQQIKDNITQHLVANANGTYTWTYGSINGPAGSGTGTLQASMAAINAEAAKYLVPISSSTVQSFAMAMADGSMDQAGVDAYLQAQATSLYPSIAGAIKAGITPADYVTPYKEVAAQLLGVSPNAIDMTNPKYNRALSAPGPNGVPTAMSLYDFQQLLMQDPQYGYMNSINAKDRASSIAQGLAEMFGKAPSGPAGSTAFSAAGAPRMPGVPIT